VRLPDASCKIKHNLFQIHTFELLVIEFYSMRNGQASGLNQKSRGLWPLSHTITAARGRMTQGTGQRPCTSVSAFYSNLASTS
jgi:hypothetical protein